MPEKVLTTYVYILKYFLFILYNTYKCSQIKNINLEMKSFHLDPMKTSCTDPSNPTKI